MEQKSLTPTEKKMAVTPGFGTLEGFELLQRMGKMFNQSALVPQTFRGSDNFGNCIIALNMAQRLQADPLMVMQNLYVVYGNPGWSSKFLIATFNACGKYSSIRYEKTGKEGTDTWGRRAYAYELATGEKLEGPEVTIAISKKEGWYDKNGSKWKTMPELMLCYRAASSFIKTTAPEISMGLQSIEEIQDMSNEYEEEQKKTVDIVAQEIKDKANKVELNMDTSEDDHAEDDAILAQSIRPQPSAEVPNF
jgi:hypothetical protein